MAKTFRAWEVDQAWLLPPSVDDFVPAGHAAHLMRDLVRETLDISAIMDAYPEERGQPPYHPAAPRPDHSVMLGCPSDCSAAFHARINS